MISKSRSLSWYLVADCCDYELLRGLLVFGSLSEDASLARLPCQRPCTADPRSLLPLMPPRAPDYLRPEVQSDVKRLITNHKAMKRDDQSNFTASHRLRHRDLDPIECPHLVIPKYAQTNLVNAQVPQVGCRQRVD
jgi:hypothetical protein